MRIIDRQDVQDRMRHGSPVIAEARAAARLEDLGYDNVLVYAAGEQHRSFTGLQLEATEAKEILR